MTVAEAPAVLPDRAMVERTTAALEERGFHTLYVPTKEEALRTVLGLVPEGASVAHGSSTTLQQIGFIDVLARGERAYRYRNKEWLAETDPRKRTTTRAVASATAEYFLGSVQAIAETGEVVAADAGGSRQAPYIFGPPHVIWVASINKIVPTLADALQRLREVALPLEDQRMKATGARGSMIGKIVIYERERPGRITLVLVGEPLGF